MPSRELSPQRAEELLERMDNLGYAGKMGSNKPEAIRLVQKAYEVKDEKQVSPTAPSEEVQSPLMPMSDLEKSEANRQAATKRLQPNGHYKPSRRRSGRKNSIDDSSAMDYIKTRSYG